MFIQPRKRRRSTRFSSGRMRTERERREHVIALATGATVRSALGVALVIAAIQLFRAVQTHASGISMSLQLFMPMLLVIGGGFSIRSGIQGFRAAREMRALPLEGLDDEPL
jgi:hypothetical protein